MYGSTCFGRPSAHHQERTTALGASWFYRWRVAVGALLVVVWQVNLPDHDQQLGPTTLQPPLSNGKTRGS
jgi:hypothetical protein